MVSLNDAAMPKIYIFGTTTFLALAVVLTPSVIMVINTITNCFNILLYFLLS